MKFTPSSRKSTETGNVSRTFSEAVTMPPDAYFDDPPESPTQARDDQARDALQEVVRRIVEALEDGPPATLPARLAALKLVYGRDDSRSLRDAAQKARCELTTLFRYIRAMKQIFRGKS